METKNLQEKGKVQERFVKIVFLDIDGVLNSAQYIRSQRYKRKEDKGLGFPDTDLDEVAIRLVNFLCKITGASIVISSAWREFSDCVPALRRNGLQAKIRGKTPKDGGWCRGREIQEWLTVNLCDEYVILDDDDDMLQCQQDHFVHIDRRTGITTKDVEKAIFILNE